MTGRTLEGVHEVVVRIIRGGDRVEQDIDVVCRSRDGHGTVVVTLTGARDDQADAVDAGESKGPVTCSSGVLHRCLEGHPRFSNRQSGTTVKDSA